MERKVARNDLWVNYSADFLFDFAKAVFGFGRVWRGLISGAEFLVGLV